MAMKQEANAPLIITIGAISCVLVLVIMFGVEAWFRYEESREVNAQWDATPNTWRDDLRAKQLANLGNINDAMTKVVETGGRLPATQPAAGSARAE